VDVWGGKMDRTKKKKSKKSKNDEKYVYFALAKEWKKVSLGILKK
jgi:hypothetical protein